MNKKDIYCVYCGSKNSSEDKNCKKCKKELNPKNHLFKDFLIDHLKDDIEGNIEDSIFALLRKWIISNLYGVGIFSAVLFTGIVIISREINLAKYDTSYKKLDTPFIVDNSCKQLDSVKKELICDEGYTLDKEKCVKTTSNNAIEYITCDNNYTLIGEYCISNFTKDYDVSTSCPWSLDGTRIGSSGIGNPSKIMDAYESGGVCYIKYCTDPGAFPEYPDSGTCNGSVDTYDSSVAPTYNYSCNGYELNGTCRYYGQRYYHYTCNEGELKEDKCEIKDVKEPVEECPLGYLYNSKCNTCVKEDA